MKTLTYAPMRSTTRFAGVTLVSFPPNESQDVFGYLNNGNADAAFEILNRAGVEAVFIPDSERHTFSDALCKAMAAKGCPIIAVGYDANEYTSMAILPLGAN